MIEAKPILRNVDLECGLPTNQDPLIGNMVDEECGLLVSPIIQTE